MLKKTASLALIAMFALAAAAGAVGVDDVFVGELLEAGCYESRGAHGTDHAACAKSCFSRGGDAGILTADGDVIILRAGDDPAPLEALKEMAGQQVKVTGTMVEEDGKMFVTVTAGEAAG